jgi:tetratricopeptide (TPR) repeat protein
VASVAFIILLLCASPLFAQTESLDAMLHRIDTLIEQKELREAATLANAAVERYPQSRAARSSLALLTLWNGDYATARRLFRELLATERDDAAAQLGLAQAEYWSGDLRSAERDFAEVVRLDPASAVAQRSLDEIRAAARPGFSAGIEGLSDDQPYRRAAAATTVYAFTDPLTRWLVSASKATFDTRGRDADTSSIAAGIDATRSRTTFRATATAFHFPDGSRKLLPRVEVLRPFGIRTLAVIAERRELLRAAPSLTTHPTVRTLTIRWSSEREHIPQFAVRAEHLGYFDGNSGVAADAYGLLPFGAVSFGGSLAYRDTHESRFIAGLYDPYYTPQDLREARLIAAVRRQLGRSTLDIHLDGGIARDRLDSLTRTFHPWRAAVTATVPLPHGLTFNAGVERNVTIYYTANEFRTSVAGRF